MKQEPVLLLDVLAFSLLFCLFIPLLRGHVQTAAEPKLHATMSQTPKAFPERVASAAPVPTVPGDMPRMGTTASSQVQTSEERR